MSKTVRGLAVPDTKYWVLVNGEGAASRVTVVHWLNQPARDLTLVDARRVGRYLLDASTDADDWPPHHLDHQGVTTEWTGS